jgi:hypothetical protein
VKIFLRVQLLKMEILISRFFCFQAIMKRQKSDILIVVMNNRAALFIPDNVSTKWTSRYVLIGIEENNKTQREIKWKISKDKVLCILHHFL